MEPGRRLAHYEIVESIGAGGMGEVYRARDSKLGRDVAIKVLPDELAKDEQRLDRFEGEARLLAQLNHSNIATLHGFEEHDGQQFLVMEVVEGETLAERIAQGRLLVDEAIPLFIQIAEGVEAAHDKGIIHRDLKPANIKIGPDGKPKILDFGLAKAFAGEQDSAPDSSQSPTLTKGTALGVIMGTASYMSPEQARGKPIDKRTDIWAFGCCLYEALVGTKAFVGETVTDTLAKIVEREPAWEAVPESTPPSIRRLLERCLRKKKEERLQSAGDIALALRDALGEASVALSVVAEPRRKQTALALAVAVSIGVVAGYLLPDSTSDDAQDTREPSHWSVSLPPNASIHREGISLSPDGKLLVAAVELDGMTQLYRKSNDSAAVEPIAGTENGSAPFFSPDGEWIGFFGDGQLWKIAVDGGRAIELCESSRTYQQASWGVDGTIVFRGELGVGLIRCSANGGEREALTQPGQFGESGHGAPTFLADGSIVFGIGGGAAEPSLALLPHDSNEWVRLPIQSRAALYVPSGYLVYEWEGRLLAAAFDPSEPTRVGREAILMDGLYDETRLTLAFAVSGSGTLAYLPGRAVLDQLVWVARDGRVVSEIGEPGVHMYPRLSPRADRLLVSTRPGVGQQPDLWIYDIDRGSRTRLTFDESAWTGEWSPDERRIAYLSNPADEGARGIYVIPVDGTSAPELLESDAYDATSWSPDGQTLLMRGGPSQGRGDVWELDVDGGRAPRPLLNESYNEHVAVFSPDGQWIAYTSDESGRTEVYVRAYPGPGRKYPVSTRGGAEPVWSRDGRELFFRDGTSMMAVDVRLGPELQVGAPRELFRDTFRPAPAVNSNYDVSPDGERFLMIRPTGEAPREIHVIVNWIQELERLVRLDE